MRLAPTIVAVALAVGSAEAATVRIGQPVMGTVLEVTVVAADARKARRWAEESVAEARRWDDLLTTWRPQGELARLNARAGLGPVAISSLLSAALARMAVLSRSTAGAFDPGVGPLVRLWSGPHSPDAEALARAAPHRMADALVLRDGSATLVAGAALDAGGIGKGMALDAIAAALRSRGASAAFVNFGGSSQIAVGVPPGSPDGWRVVLSGTAPGSLHGELFLRDAALSTSHAAGAGAAEGPIVDPRTGLAVAGPRLATVVGRNAAAAEAWSKAVIVFGRAGIDRATEAGIEVLYEDASGTRLSERFPLRKPPEPLP